MGYELAIGDRIYSSWSLRGWLLFEAFGLSAKIRRVHFGESSVAEQLPDLAPARTVPVVTTPEGAVIWDSLAIAEELATRHPEAGFWPADPAARATARSLAAEMHSGYGALREACPMHLGVAYQGYEPSETVAADVARVESLWAWTRDRFAAEGPWLFGQYTAVDAFFAPVAARFATYGLGSAPETAAYVAAHLSQPEFRRWCAMGFASWDVLPWYKRDFATRPWPGPVPLAARALETGTPENDACPYSGEPVTHLAEIDGHVIGFCNAFCRDKTVADPEAWPKVMALLA